MITALWHLKLGENSKATVQTVSLFIKHLKGMD